CWAINKLTRQPIKDPKDSQYQQHILRLKNIPNTKFITFAPATGSWVFEVEDFTISVKSACTPNPTCPTCPPPKSCDPLPCSPVNCPAGDCTPSECPTVNCQPIDCPEETCIQPCDPETCTITNTIEDSTYVSIDITTTVTDYTTPVITEYTTVITTGYTISTEFVANTITVYTTGTVTTTTTKTIYNTTNITAESIIDILKDNLAVATNSITKISHKHEQLFYSIAALAPLATLLLVSSVVGGYILYKKKRTPGGSQNPRGVEDGSTNAGAKQQQEEEKKENHKIKKPKIEKYGYYSFPLISDLKKMPKEELKQVKDFTVGKYNVGNILYSVPVDLSEIEPIEQIFGKTIVIEDKNCIVYGEGSSKPSVGSGLNKRAVITLDECWAINKLTRQPIKDPKDSQYQQHILRLKNIPNTKFITFVPATGSWVFEVEDFTIN
ncbi:4472_t:CDS:2, partial [Entrophospora sp. SA101]